MSIDVRYGLTDDELDGLVTLYEDYEWWADRDRDAIRRAVAGTDELVALEDDETGDLLAAARVLTDYVYYATIYNVIVAADARGDGLGQRLLDEVVIHPELQDLARLSLFCREGLESFYEVSGFERSPMVALIPERDGEEAELIRMVHERE